MRIDSHQHFWKVGQFDYPWMSPTAPLLYRDYLPRDLAPLLAPAGIAKTIVVQASPSVAETEFLLMLAAETEFVAGVVGWLDLDAPAFADHLARQRRNPWLVGLRPAIELVGDDRWLLRPRVLASLCAMAEVDMPLDLIVWPRHLPVVLEMLDRLAPLGLRCVVDHLAKPDVRNAAIDPWRTLIAQIAQYPNVACKLSGLMTQADHDRWAPQDLRPYLDHVVGVFGLSRVMFGSDWPVSLLAADYATTVSVVRDAVTAAASPEQMNNVLGGNAKHFYKLRLPTAVA